VQQCLSHGLGFLGADQQLGKLQGKVECRTRSTLIGKQILHSIVYSIYYARRKRTAGDDIVVVDANRLLGIVVTGTGNFLFHCRVGSEPGLLGDAVANKSNWRGTNGGHNFSALFLASQNLANTRILQIQPRGFIPPKHEANVQELTLARLSEPG
jgi:hypothetical protein